MTCDQTQQQLELHFIEGTRAAPAVLDHARGCPDCRSRYQLLHEAEALLDGAERLAARPVPRLGVAEKEVLLAGLLEEVPPARARGLWARLFRPRALAGLGAAAAVATALLLVLGRPAELAPRGSLTRSAAGPVPVARPFGLRLLCLKEGPAGLEVRSLRDRPVPGEDPSCTARDRLGFTYRNETGRRLPLALAYRRHTPGADGWRRVGAPLEVDPTSAETPEAPLSLDLPAGPAGRLSLVAVAGSDAELVPRLQRGEPLPEALRFEVVIGP